MSFLLSFQDFMTPKVFQTCFTQQRSNLFEDLIQQGPALVFVDDILLIKKSESHLLQLIKQHQDETKRKNMKISPEKPFFFLYAVKNIGRDFCFKTVEAVQSKKAPCNKIRYPTTQTELMRFFDLTKFCSKNTAGLHDILKPSLIFFTKTLHYIGLLN